MGAVRFLVASDLRRRWRVWLGLALLVGLAGSAVLGAAAGARRTASAYTRLVDETNAFDVLVNPDAGDMDFAKVERLPQVAAAGRVTGVFMVAATKDGSAADLSKLDEEVYFLARDRRAGRTIHRPKVLHGRLADPDRVDEVFVTKSFADGHGTHVGDALQAFFLNEEEGAPVFEAEQQPGDLPRGTKVRLRVVGIGIGASDIPVAAVDRLPEVFLTPAFGHRYHPYGIFTGSLVDLTRGQADVPAFLRAAQRTAGDKEVFFQTQGALAEKAGRASRPYWGALAVFAVVAGLASLLIIGQAVGRQLALEAGELGVVRGLGMSRTQLVLAGLSRVAVVAVGGAVLAVIGAWISSALMPIGTARLAEPHPGLAVDGPVLLLGGMAIVVLLIAAGAVPALRAARGRAPAATRSSRLGNALAAAGFSPSASAGVRLALEPGAGRSSMPVRATIAAAAIALGSLAAAVTFAVSLNRLLDTPRLYGGDFSAFIQVNSEGLEESRARVPVIRRTLEQTPGVAGFAEGAHVQLTIGTTPVPGVALRAAEGRPVFPTIVTGRAPRKSNEILLGASTRQRAGVALGDTVKVAAAGSARTMRVVGEAVFPRFSAYPGADKTGLGEGAALTVPGLRSLIDVEDENFDFDFFLATFRPGVAPVPERAQIKAALVEAIAGTGPLDEVRVLGPERPDDILGYEDVSATPLVLAGLLAVVAGATTAHALVSSVRRRRRDLALLKTIGFQRRQVRATVAWQATTVAVAALLVGLPLGVAAGRWGWTLLAARMHAVPQPVTPALALAASVPLVLLIANLVAALPARTAARTRPAVILRTE